jgi:hypothetical protein
MNLKIAKVLLLLPIFAFITVAAYEVKYAVNVGGDSHVDSDGIRYEKDNYNGTATFKHKWTVGLNIGRVPERDRNIYDYFRFSDSIIHYKLPYLKDGHYILNLKFSDTDSRAPNYIVFDAQLNGKHLILSRLDVYQKAGKNRAYDEFIHFDVCDNGQRLYYKDEVSDIKNEKISLEFMKVNKVATIAAILLLKGSSGEEVRFNSSTTSDTVRFGGGKIQCSTEKAPPSVVNHFHFNIVNNYYNGKKTETMILDDSEL